MKMKKKFKVLSTVVALAVLALSGCTPKHSESFQKQATMSASSGLSKANKKASYTPRGEVGLNHLTTYKQLAQMDFKSGQKSYITVNNDKSTFFESKVRDALRANKKVIYQATPIFRGNELMARGINLQAISTDKSLDFNVYIFNVQPGYVFNYANGNSTMNKSFIVDNKKDYDSSDWHNNYLRHIRNTNRVQSHYHRNHYKFNYRKYN